MRRRLHVQASGKHQGRPPISAVAAGPEYTVSLRDSNSGITFLFDSGANVSLVPATAADKESSKTGPPLLAVNGTAIRSYGSRRLQLNLNGFQCTWTFVVADVDGGIIGADFLCNNNLLVDMRNGALLHSETLAVLACTRDPRPPTPRICRIQTACEFRSLLTTRPKLTTPDFHVNTPKHGVELHIDTEGPPVFAKARPLPPDKLAAAKRQFLDMEKLGILRRSHSAWSSPLHMVNKSDGTYRPCGDSDA